MNIFIFFSECFFIGCTHRESAFKYYFQLIISLMFTWLVCTFNNVDNKALAISWTCLLAHVGPRRWRMEKKVALLLCKPTFFPHIPTPLQFWRLEKKALSRLFFFSSYCFLFFNMSLLLCVALLDLHLDLTPEGKRPHLLWLMSLPYCEQWWRFT